MPSVILAGTTTGSALSLTSDTSGELQIQTNNGATTAMTLTTGGNVGIGTSSPTVPFIVTKGVAGADLARLLNDNFFGFRFVAQTGGSGANSMMYVAAGESLALGSNGTERMRITSAGDVGIGTSSPNSRVTIGSNATDAVLSGTTNTTGLNLYARAFGISQIDSLTSSSNNSGMSLRTYNNGTYTEFIANDQGNTTRFQTAGIERMRITSASEVLIGTTTGFGAGSGRQLLCLNGTSSTNITCGVGGAQQLYLYSDASSTQLITVPSVPLILGTNNAERIRISNTGELLVGGTSNVGSGYKTVIYSGGNVLAQSTTAGNGTAYSAFFNNTTLIGSISNNNNTGVLFNTTSDYRLKTVIAPVADAGQRIDALKPIEYDWNTGDRAKGFLAHQFAEVYPNSVTGEKDAVDAEGNPVYQTMQASSTEVMADLIAEIQSLRKRVAQLESK
jgi:hypothetical protein